MNTANWYSIRHDTLTLPACIGIASGIILLVHLIIASKILKRLHAFIFLPNNSNTDFEEEPTPGTEPPPSSGPSAEIRAHITEHGGLHIFAYKIVRLCGCLILLALSIYSAETSNYGSQGFDIFGKWGKKHKPKKHRTPKFSVKDWLEVAICMTYVNFPRILPPYISA